MKTYRSKLRYAITAESSEVNVQPLLELYPFIRILVVCVLVNFVVAKKCVVIVSYLTYSVYGLCMIAATVVNLLCFKQYLLGTKIH